MLVGTRENVRRHISFVYARFSVTYNLSCAVATTVEHEHLVSHISSTCGRAHALCRAARAGWGCRRAAAAQHSDAPTRRRLGVDGAADVSPSPVLAVARWWGGGVQAEWWRLATPACARAKRLSPTTASGVVAARQQRAMAGSI